MDIGQTLFFTFIASFMSTLTISYWLGHLTDISCLGYVIIFVVSAVVVFVFQLLAPVNVKIIAMFVGAGIALLTAIICKITNKK